jgi:signal transduction histidine kinase/GAF domain-containing protein
VRTQSSFLGYIEVVGSRSVAIRPSISEDTTALLTAILDASNTGVLLTDLNHRSLACNSTFGEIFRLDPAEVVQLGVEELRSKVLPLIKDRREWLKNLDHIYSDPLNSFEDELELKSGSIESIRRFTGPVCASDGRLIGRLWTFADVTPERQRRKKAEVLQRISTLADADPRRVCKVILKEIAQYYKGTTALLSILKGSYLEFQGVEGPIGPAKLMKGNEVENSYCQFVLKQPSPVIIQDARVELAGHDLPVTRAGLTRYMGVPIHDPQGTLVGTLCIVDKHSEKILGKEDLEFLALLAMRVSAELGREAYIADRLQRNQEEVDRQRKEIEETRSLLDALHRGFALLARNFTTEELVKEQVSILSNVLGFEHVALATGGTSWSTSASAVAAHDAEERTVSISLPLRSGELEIGNLTLESDRDIDVDSQRLNLYIEAIYDQVELVLAVHWLNRELSDTHAQLLQSEKLNVVGSLAAATAHDIRNILSALDVELASSGSSAVEKLGSVKKQLGRFNILAHRLLSYAKPALASKANADVSELIDSVKLLLSATLRVSEIDVTTQVSPDSVAYMDVDQVEHLLVNLLLNATQHMPRGGSILIKAKPVRDRIQFEVSDTGVGMSPEIEGSLFEPFRSGRANGFGLGLFSCKRIVEEHGGQISVQPSLGGGTTFLFTLPAARSAA